MRKLACLCMSASVAVMLVSIQPIDAKAQFPTPTTAVLSSSCANSSTGLTALTDLGGAAYHGEQGGLYPGGSNTPPAAYQNAGFVAARSIVRVDSLGRASSAGRIGFLSIGMSNTAMEFSSFRSQEATDVLRNPSLVMVDGAQFGVPAAAWTSAAAPAWSVVEQRLAAAGMTDGQVEVIWLKQADVVYQPMEFETYARTLQKELSQIVTIAAQRYPNLRQVFVSARTYGGYSGINKTGGGPNPEPWAYETGFADKWLVAQSVASPAQRPWVGWGPYFWTDGLRGRADGMQWLCSNTVDHTHPSATGLAKLNTAMHAMFITSPFTPWFRA